MYREDPDAAVSFYGGDVLELFLAVRTEMEVLTFLNRLGTYFYSDQNGHLDSNEAWQPGLESVAEFFEWQGIVRKLMLAPPTSWGLLTRVSNDAVEPVKLDFPGDGATVNVGFGGLLDTLDLLKASAIADSFRFSLNFVWMKNGKHYLRIEAADILKAIMAAIGLSHVSKATYRFCRRPDCGKAFVLETKHSRKYCSWDCGHTVAVRSSRARAAKKKKLGKLPKKASK